MCIRDRNKIAIETSSELLQKLIGIEVNNSSISAIVDDLSKRNGDKYYGEWKNGKKNGFGTYTFPDGKQYVGEFNSGKLLNATVFTKKGFVIGKFKDGIYTKESIK